MRRLTNAEIAIARLRYAEYNRNISAASRLTGISRPTLHKYRDLQKWDRWVTRWMRATEKEALKEMVKAMAARRRQSYS